MIMASMAMKNASKKEKQVSLLITTIYVELVLIDAVLTGGN